MLDIDIIASSKWSAVRLYVYVDMRSSHGRERAKSGTRMGLQMLDLNQAGWLVIILFVH